MKEKWAVITGPTSGLGKQTARQLVALGANLVLACRDIERGRATADELSLGAEEKAKLEVMRLDTSSLASIREFAARFRDKHPTLDVLINNAGVNRAEQPRENSVDGLELTWATNVLGYHLLTRELLGPLQAGVPSRIVYVASTFAGDLDLDDLQFERRPYDGMKAYSQSKACDRLLAWAWARRLTDAGVAINAMAPGLVPGTNLFSKMAEETRETLSQRSGTTIAQGADTVVWLASSPEVQGVNGRLFEQRREVDCSFRNVEDEEKLWLICETLAG